MSQVSAPEGRAQGEGNGHQSIAAEAHEHDLAASVAVGDVAAEQCPAHLGEGGGAGDLRDLDEGPAELLGVEVLVMTSTMPQPTMLMVPEHDED